MRKITKWIISLFVASSAVGGVYGADVVINPYLETDTALELATVSTLQDAGSIETELLKKEPKVILHKWNKEVNLGVKYKGINPNTKGNRALLTNRMEWKDNREKQELHAYPLPAGEGMEDGGFEIEIVLDQKPKTNVFEFQIDGYEDLDFFYQAELTQEEIDEGAERPENVVGSYAVYHNTKANHCLGDNCDSSTNYATGKAFHIYRPKAIDNNGVEQWAELSYSNGVLSVTVPQSFLDNAVYPVRVDPTFGYTTVGSSNYGVLNYLYTSPFAAPEDGTVTNISIYFSHSLQDGNVSTYVIYDGSNRIDYTEEFTHNIASAAGWDAGTAQVGGSLVNSTTYYLGFFNKNNISYFKYDSGVNPEYQSVSYVYPPPATWSSTTSGTSRKFSVYATYTASGGGGAVGGLPTLDVPIILE